MILTILALLAVAATIGLAFLDFRTYGVWYRPLLIILSGALLVGFILNSGSNGEDVSRITVLTDGAELYDVQTSEATIYSIEVNGSLHADNDQIRWLSSIEMLSELEEPGRKVEIVGHGTNSRLSHQFRWVDRLRDPGEGILFEGAPQQVWTGSDFTITGKIISQAIADSVALYRDGDRINAQILPEDGKFVFTDRLQVEGPALYHVEAMVADSLHRELWHVRAVEAEPLTVAALLYSPSFEITHLAEWLGKNGHRLAMRTKVGKERFRFDEINEPPAVGAEIMENSSSFDLLILDPREFSQLSTGQIQMISESVLDGLDLLILPPTDDNESTWEQAVERLSGEEINVIAESRIEERRWSPEFIDLSRSMERPDVRLPILNYSFEGIQGETTVIGRFENREPVIIRTNAGSGSVSSHLFYQTYSWKLRGDEPLYGDFWAGYLDEIITLEVPFVDITAELPRLHERIGIYSSGSELSVRQPSGGQSVEIPLLKGFEHPGVNAGYFWPRSIGWHVVESGDSNRWFYVYDVESDWLFSESYARFQATRSDIQRLELSQTTDDPPFDELYSARWWLIGFFIIQVVLWAERKVVGG